MTNLSPQIYTFFSILPRLRDKKTKNSSKKFTRNVKGLHFGVKVLSITILHQQTLYNHLAAESLVLL